MAEITIRYGQLQYLAIKFEQKVKPVVMKLNIPTAFLLSSHPRSILDVVADNLDIFCFGSHKMNQKSTNDIRHTGREHNNRNVVLPTPGVKFLEVRVELDVLDQSRYTFRERSVNAVQHFLEGLTEAFLSIEDIYVPLTPFRLPIA
jgi:hypothetical protein